MDSCPDRGDSSRAEGTVSTLPNERVSVVVPCRNESARIASLLDAIRLQERPVLEVVIVDTGSTDGTIETVSRYQRHYPMLSLRCLSHPGTSVADAMNRGIEAAQGEIVVRLDGHSRPSSEYVKLAVEALRETDAVVVGGVWDIAPGGATLIAEAISRAVAHPVGAGDAVYRLARTTGGRREVDTVPFGCFRKATWAELGGFNDYYPNEDYEFNYRVRSRGALIVLDPGIRCTYFSRTTLGDLAKQYFRYGWAKRQVLSRHPRSLRWRQALPAMFVPLLACLAVTGLVWPISTPLLAGCVIGYGAILSGAAIQVAARERHWSLVWPLIAAFATVHGSWSAGFATNALSFGHWPRWRNQEEMEAGQRGFSGVGLLKALAGILVLTTLIPPGFAKLIDWSRVDRAREDVSRLVDALQDVRLADRTGNQAMGNLLGGPGITPEAPSASQWADGSVDSLGSFVSLPLRPDPWGNRYLFNVGVLRMSEATEVSTSDYALWVLSAGANGIIETPYAVPRLSFVVGGDDIGARIK